MPVTVRFYRFKNRLKEKCAGLAPGDAGISDEALAEAEAALSAMAEDYPDWVSSLIDRLAEQHRRCVDTPEERKEFFAEVGRIAHDMKGQGGTFGYPLISHFGESLYQFTKPREAYSDDDVEIVKAHIDAMSAVIKDRVSGDGGEIGQQLTDSLNEAIEKYKV